LTIFPPQLRICAREVLFAQPAGYGFRTRNIQRENRPDPVVKSPG